MKDHRTDWTALLSAIVTILILTIVQFGCAAKGNAAGVNTGQQVTADRVELMESALVDMDRKLEIEASVRQDATGGRDVTINDPWTGRIAVAGLGLIPLSFVVYLVAHRIKAIRNVMDALKGKPCIERMAGRCIPTPDPVPPEWRKAVRAFKELHGEDPVIGFGPQDDVG